MDDNENEDFKFLTSVNLAFSLIDTYANKRTAGEQNRHSLLVIHYHEDTGMAVSITDGDRTGQKQVNLP